MCQTCWTSPKDSRTGSPVSVNWSCLLRCTYILELIQENGRRSYLKKYVRWTKAMSRGQLTQRRGVPVVSMIRALNGRWVAKACRRIPARRPPSSSTMWPTMSPSSLPLIISQTNRAVGRKRRLTDGISVALFESKKNIEHLYLSVHDLEEHNDHRPLDCNTSLYAEHDAPLARFGGPR